MQTQEIIVIPPTHEQSAPSFHVAGGSAKAFLDFLAERGVKAWHPPEALYTRGPDGHRVIEVEIEADTPVDFLRGLAEDFLSQRK